jgi:hypothetical protein
MAEAIATLSLISSIIQLIEFSAKVVKRLDEFDMSLGDVPRTFRSIKIELPLITDSLRRTKEQAESNRLDKATLDALLPVIEACYGEVKMLYEVIHDAVPSPGSSSWERRKKAILSLGKDKKVEKSTEALRKYMKTLTLHHTIEGARIEIRPSKPTVYTIIPFDKNPTFVGREDIFHQIENAFDVKNGYQPKAALCGLGGIGYGFLDSQITRIR